LQIGEKLTERIERVGKGDLISTILHEMNAEFESAPNVPVVEVSVSTDLKGKRPLNENTADSSSSSTPSSSLSESTPLSATFLLNSKSASYPETTEITAQFIPSSTSVVGNNQESLQSWGPNNEQSLRRQQIKEMLGIHASGSSSRNRSRGSSDAPSSDTMSRKPITFHWQADETAVCCTNCQKRFNLFVRRHHCRYFTNNLFINFDGTLFLRWCGSVFCDTCSSQKVNLGHYTNRPDGDVINSQTISSPGTTLYRVCKNCFEFLKDPSVSPIPPSTLFSTSSDHISSQRLPQNPISNSAPETPAMNIISTQSLDTLGSAFTNFVNNVSQTWSGFAGSASPNDDSPLAHFTSQEENNQLLTPVTSVGDSHSVAESVMTECPGEMSWSAYLPNSLF
jgi:hypothetical protein